MTTAQWPSERRIDAIGQNGAITTDQGQHYHLLSLYQTEARLERGLEVVREQIREYINQHNLNKGAS